MAVATQQQQQQQKNDIFFCLYWKGALMRYSGELEMRTRYI